MVRARVRVRVKVRVRVRVSVILTKKSTFFAREKNMTGVTALVSVIEKSASVSLYHEYSRAGGRLQIHDVGIDCRCVKTKQER